MEGEESDSVIEILNELDKLELAEDAENKQSQSDEPFLLPMQIIHNIKGVGIAVIGKATSGMIAAGDNVELMGGVPMPTNKKLMTKNMNIEANVASLKLFDHTVKTGSKRDYLGVALHGNNVNTKNVKRGMYVVKQGKGRNAGDEIKAYWRFKCDVEFFESESGHLEGSGDGDDYIGKSTPISTGFQPVFHLGTSDISGKIESIPAERNGVLMPGEQCAGITVCLQQSAVVWKDMKFILREGGRTIGAGVVTETIDLFLVKMANVMADTSTVPSEGNEAVAYLVEHGVKLTNEQRSALIEMDLTKTDLGGMSLGMDPSGTAFNDFCKELAFGIGPRLKMRSAINAMDIPSDEKTTPSTNVPSKSILAKSVKKMKIAVIGNAGVGKSSLLTRFLDDTFDEERVETVGVDIRDKIINIGDAEVHLSLLDTAGQERFGSIANWYFRSSHAFIIVYDITNKQSFADLAKWMEQLDDRASDYAIRFVVGTKVDLKNNRRVLKSDGETFANTNGYRFCEVSSKSGRNINQVFTTVALYVIQREVVEKFEENQVAPMINKSDISTTSPRLIDPGQSRTQSGIIQLHKRDNPVNFTPQSYRDNRGRGSSTTSLRSMRLKTSCC